MSSVTVGVGVLVVGVALPLVVNRRGGLATAAVLALATLPWATAVLRAGMIAHAHVTRAYEGRAPVGMEWMDATVAMAAEAQTGLEVVAGVAVLLGVAHVGISQRPGGAGMRGWAGFGWLGLLAGTAAAGSVALQEARGHEATSWLVPLTVGIVGWLAGSILAWRRGHPVRRAVAPAVTMIGLAAGSAAISDTLLRQVVEATAQPTFSVRASHGGLLLLEGPSTVAVEVTIPRTIVDAARDSGGVQLTFDVERAGTATGFLDHVRWPDGSVTRRRGGPTPLLGCARQQPCTLTLLTVAPYAEPGEHTWLVEADVTAPGPTPRGRLGVGEAYVEGPSMSVP